jgi:DNA-binding GntR family transcriptional regulator
MRNEQRWRSASEAPVPVRGKSVVDSRVSQAVVLPMEVTEIAESSKMSASMIVEAEAAAARESAADISPGREGAKLEQAYQRLKQDIISGAYSPNERLVEAPLTRALGVSRNTLRTVLARLKYEGLVVLEPNRGGRVRAFSPAEAQELLRVREALEALVAGLAAVRATPEQCARLRVVVAETEQAVEDDDVLRCTALNRRFHEQVVEAAGSPQAAASLDSLHFPLVKFQFQAGLVPGRKAQTLEEHRDLLRAIEAGDPEAAERAARLHIQQVRFAAERSGPPIAAPPAR